MFSSGDLSALAEMLANELMPLEDYYKDMLRPYGDAGKSH